MSKASRERERLRAERYHRTPYEKSGPSGPLTEKQIEWAALFILDQDHQKFHDFNDPWVHEEAHKRLHDHFFPDDPAWFEVEGSHKVIKDFSELKDGERPMTCSKRMKDGTERLNWNAYGKVLVAGYVGEIIALHLESKLEDLLKFMIINALFGARRLANQGASLSEIFNRVWTNDDGKYTAYAPKELRNDDQKMIRSFINDAKWVLNFLKNN